jgi:hypothetical protein
MILPIIDITMFLLPLSVAPLNTSDTQIAITLPPQYSIANVIANLVPCWVLQNLPRIARDLDLAMGHFTILMLCQYLDLFYCCLHFLESWPVKFLLEIVLFLKLHGQLLHFL